MNTYVDTEINTERIFDSPHTFHKQISDALSFKDWDVCQLSGLFISQKKCLIMAFFTEKKVVITIFNKSAFFNKVHCTI